LVPSSEADSRFYAYALSVSTEQLTVRGKGTTFLELSSFELGTFPLPSPSLATQRAIAAFLDRETAKIDALIAEQQRLIELLQEKRQAFISHAVTKGLNPRAAMKDSGIEWLGEVPEHWTIPPMFARYEAVLGKMVDEKKATGTCPVPYLRNADVYWDQINTAELPLLDIQPHERLRFTVRKGDILICEGGAGIGQTAIWHGDDDVTAFQKALHRLRPWDNSRENPRYLFYCMRVVVESGVMLAGGTATIPHLTGEVLRRYRFPCPPIREQQEIVHYLDATGQEMQSLSEQASHAITLLQERRSALISAAVTGQIDVRGFSSGGSEAA
jgi:type I restriction enzyme S subunit